MTARMMIEELQKFNPDARVMMHDWRGDEVLFVLKAANDYPTSNVWLEGLEDIDIDEELKAELECAVDEFASEADFYAWWLEKGITPDMVELYVSEEAARHMIEVCEEHGLI